MTARALLRDAISTAAPGGPNVIVQIDHWAILPATMTKEQAAVELCCGVDTVKRLIRDGKLRRIVDVPGFLVSTSSVRNLVEGSPPAHSSPRKSTTPTSPTSSSSARSSAQRARPRSPATASTSAKT